MKCRSYRISVPSPCHEDFSAMKNAGDGKYCARCKHIVYDFTQMTDYELLLFFETKPRSTCGQFHRSQLHRTIEVFSIKKTVGRKLLRIAASILTVFTIKPYSATAQNVPTFNTSQIKPGDKSLLSEPEVVLSGIVTDEDDKPLSKVHIKIENLGETETNDQGKYVFRIEHLNISCNLYFSCINFVPAVRSYNPAMRSTQFDVKMGRRDTSALSFSNSLGGIAVISISDPELPTLVFKNKEIKLTAQMIRKLHTAATALKRNPGVTITVNAYPGQEERHAISIRRVEAVKNYLVNNEGISPQRVQTNLEVDGGDINAVELKEDF